MSRSVWTLVISLAVWLVHGDLGDELVTVTAEVVDRYCWVNNSGVSLDTQVDLTLFPDQHTIHCLAEVGICIDSGYVLVHQPGGANTAYEVLYTVDDVGNSILLAAMLSSSVNVDRNLPTGYTHTLSGIITTGDTSGVGDSPILKFGEELSFITGWVVDIYCWVTNNGLALDTGVDLTMAPENHTLHCLVEVARCRDSGFGFVVWNAAQQVWELAYTFDAGQNARIIGDMWQAVDPATVNDPTGFRWTAFGLFDAADTSGVDGTPILEYPGTNRTLSITGYIVDIYCWVTNNGFALDTGDNLKIAPQNHTLHCLGEVPRCIDSGFVMVYLPANATEYRVLYTLGEAMNELIRAELLNRIALYGANEKTGQIFTLRGVSDGSRNGVDNSSIFDTVEAMRTVPTGCNAGSLTSTSGVLDDFTVTVDIDCDTEVVIVVISNANYNNNWFGIVFAESMVGRALIYTTGKQSETTRTAGLYSYTITATNLAGVNYDGAATDWNLVTSETVGGVFKLIYTTSLANSPFTNATELVPFRWAQGDSLVLDPHTSQSSEFALLDLAEGIQVVEPTETPTNAPTVASSGGSGCNGGGVVPRNATNGPFTFGIDIDCDTEMVTVTVVNSQYDNNWFGIVFADGMIGDVLMWTTQSGTLSLYPYTNTGMSAATVNFNDGDAAWTQISRDESNGVLTLVFETTLDNSPWDLDTDRILFRYAYGASDATTVSYHGPRRASAAERLFFGAGEEVYTPPLEIVSVTGQIVDIFCWDTNDRTSLDTQADLESSPELHTLHCLAEVEQCITSGYIVVLDEDGDGLYAPAYTVDPYGNAVLLQAMLDEIDSGVDANAPLGFEYTVTGIIAAGDTSGLEGTPILFFAQEVQFIHGWVVDLFCWDTNNRVTLDTSRDLTTEPDKHTLHCLVEVEQCVNSGFGFVALNEATGQYELAYQFDSVLNERVVAAMLESEVSARTAETGFYWTAFGVFDSSDTSGTDGVPILESTVDKVVAVEGYLVDIFCWVDNGGRALDTKDDLTIAPWNHTLHCLVEVPQCVSSGFVFVYKPEGATQYEVLYTLDATLNEFVTAAMLAKIQFLGDAYEKTGFRATLRGVDDGSTDGIDGSSILQDILSLEPTTTSASTGASGCALADLVPASAEIDGFNVTVFINCDADTATVTIGSPSDAGTWFGIVFADGMVGRALIWTTGQSDEHDVGLYPYTNTALSGSGVNYDGADADWTKVFAEDVDGTFTVEYTTSIENSLWTRDTDTVQFRWAMGSGSTTLSYHGRDGRAGAAVTLDLLTGASEAAVEDLSLEYAHGVIMWITWALCASFGIMSSSFRFLYPKGPYWFLAHRGVQVAVVILCITAFVIAIVFTGEAGAVHFAGPHQMIGLVVTILCVLQPLNALARAHPPMGGWPNGVKPTKRVVWEWVHKASGYIAWVLGCFNIMGGLFLVGSETLALVHIFGWCGLLFVVYVALSILGYLRKRQMQQIQSMDDTGEMATKQPEDMQDMMQGHGQATGGDL